MNSKTKYICFEVPVSAELPYIGYRQVIKKCIIKRFPGLLMRGVPVSDVMPYHPADLDSFNAPVTEEIYLDLQADCGCYERFGLMDIPLEDLDCPCGKSTYFKFTKR